ncbi:metal binding domain of Ada-domain-containing protein [Xylaria sp. FL0064]|nr:metal binding domain of Ada-domain-containing protein [Xylaria sp. FL0064]
MTRTNTVAIPRDKPKSAHSSSSAIDETRWRLVVAHTPTSDFLYAVLSTGIFCRTSCPSRRPRRSNVRFFESASSAVAAGFRACRRCRPESTDSSHESPRASAEKQVEAACEFMHQRKGEAQLLEVAAHVGLSPRYFHGLFKQILGTTPGAYAAAIRSESSTPMTPATAVLYSTPSGSDFGNATDPAQLIPIDDTACNIPSVESQQITCDWLPGSFENSGCTDLDQVLCSDWFNDCDLDISSFLGTNYGVLEPQIETYSSDFMDPSLLNS